MTEDEKRLKKRPLYYIHCILISMHIDMYI